MDSAPTIKSRIEAMKQVHEAGIRTTCFISPIFPGITNVFPIIEEIKDFCDYIWLENLNLRGTFKPTIINYINEKYPELNDLYNKIYIKKDMFYWEELDKKVQEYADKNGFMYVIDEEPFLKNPTGKPIIINYFYHEKIRQSSKNK
jgi:DNA repair photolyase